MAFFAPSRRGSWKGELPYLFHRAILTRLLWKELGISWKDMEDMEPQVVKTLLTLFNVEAELQAADEARARRGR